MSLSLPRLHEDIIARHFEEERQMLLLSGPRQVGKTTTSRQAGSLRPASVYLDWDNQDDRELILRGPAALAQRLNLDTLTADSPLVILDELHKYGKWKTLLKGLFDSYGQQVDILVTGSARLDIFKAGGDSLMGRYFPFRMHPLSVGELLHPRLPDPERDPLLNREPALIPADQFAALLRFGGFPEPFCRQQDRFSRRWRRLRQQQLFAEDLRDLTRIQELGQVEVLAELLRRQAGQLTRLTTLSRAINATVVTVKRWIQTLESLYYCFAVRPWSRNIARALRKEPKFYLWDWSLVDDKGARAENFVASALLKCVHIWTDLGYGDFGLFFLRDKQKREVDFLVTRDDQPWFLVEVKSAGTAPLSPQLAYFQRQSGAAHAFQVALDLPAVGRDAFAHNEPIIVPAASFLAQLV